MVGVIFEELLKKIDLHLRNTSWKFVSSWTTAWYVYTISSSKRLLFCLRKQPANCCHVTRASSAISNATIDSSFRKAVNWRGICHWCRDIWHSYFHTATNSVFFYTRLSSSQASYLVPSALSSDFTDHIEVFSIYWFPLRNSWWGSRKGLYHSCTCTKVPSCVWESLVTSQQKFLSPQTIALTSMLMYKHPQKLPKFSKQRQKKKEEY